jgi:hypothetical protein
MRSASGCPSGRTYWPNGTNSRNARRRCSGLLIWATMSISAEANGLHHGLSLSPSVDVLFCVLDAREFVFGCCIICGMYERIPNVDPDI